MNWGNFLHNCSHGLEIECVWLKWIISLFTVHLSKVLQTLFCLFYICISFGICFDGVLHLLVSLGCGLWFVALLSLPEDVKKGKWIRSFCIKCATDCTISWALYRAIALIFFLQCGRVFDVMDCSFMQFSYIRALVFSSQPSSFGSGYRDACGSWYIWNLINTPPINMTVVHKECAVWLCRNVR